MSTDYGVDPSGNPLPGVNDAPAGGTTGNGCPDGYVPNPDGSGKCIVKPSTIVEGDKVPGSTVGSPNAPKTPGYNPEEARQRWLASGITDPALIQKFLSDNSDVTQGITTASDKWTYPSQYGKYTTVDLIGNSKDPNVANRSTTFGGYGDGKSQTPTPKSPGSGGPNPTPDATSGLCIDPNQMWNGTKCVPRTATGIIAGTKAPITPYKPNFALKPYDFSVNQYKAPNETPTYDPNTYTPGKFDAPEDMRTRTTNVINRLLETTSLDPATVAQMKESQKGSLVSMAEQQKQGINQDAARRNVDPRNVAGVDANLMSDISKSYRDIDIQKAGINRSDSERAVGLSGDYNKMLLDEYLGKESVGMGTAKFNADEGYRGYGSEVAKGDTDFSRWLAQEGLNLTGQSANASEQARVQTADFQNWATSQGINLNMMQLNQDESQFSRNLQLLIAKFLAEK